MADELDYRHSCKECTALRAEIEQLKSPVRGRWRVAFKEGRYHVQKREKFLFILWHVWVSIDTEYYLSDAQRKALEHADREQRYGHHDVYWEEGAENKVNDYADSDT